ncbi:MAG: rhodanese-like domain-containing protein [Chitinophagaceae bacterium]|nr:rhodanese-like domain-containing protein [Chitinophagaceae bacterium]MCW5927248.1 rhodanese-like domain-containing protein [Chitinophagaceae bacterium]
MSFFSILFGKTDNTVLNNAIKEGAFLVDVRTPGEFSSGTVHGAVNIPLDRITAELAKFKGKKNIVVFCRSGSRSSQAKGLLEQKGFQNVVNGGTWTNVKNCVET